jgi:transcriptional regulator NrdR family protein
MFSNEIKSKLASKDLKNAISERIYEALRFKREGDTPEWQIGGNSIAQTEARQCEAAISEMVQNALKNVEHDAVRRFAAVVRSEWQSQGIEKMNIYLREVSEAKYD